MTISKIYFVFYENAKGEKMYDLMREMSVKDVQKKLSLNKKFICAISVNKVDILTDCLDTGAYESLIHRYTRTKLAREWVTDYLMTHSWEIRCDLDDIQDGVLNVCE